MITTKQFAEKTGVSEQRVRQWLDQKRIDGAKKIGRDWIIPEDATVERRPVGRPKGSGWSKEERAKL